MLDPLALASSFDADEITTDDAPSSPPARPSMIVPRRVDDPFVRDLLALRPDLYARALRLTRDPIAADDLVQDSIERALKFRGQFHPGTSLRSWAHTIVFSLFITAYRRRRRERDAVRLLANDPCAWTETRVATIDASTLDLSPPVRRAVEALPASFRDVLLLVDVAEVSYRDAADTLAVPLGTVMSRLHRARRALAAALSDAQADSALLAA